MLLSQRAMSPRSAVFPAILLWLVLACTIIAGNRELLFATEVHETGDFAVNALQIDHAKRFGEIYGNYSRFHFHHPGPAFFYVYALGERLLVDLGQVMPSPFNAHVAAGILLQTGFFTLALVLLAEALDRRRTLTLGLLVGVLHFGLVKHAFTGTWPPEVLLMPFLAFFAAAVSVASGRMGRLPWLVLAGSFLVHGHVAQPLFVVTLALLAYVHEWRRVPGPRLEALRALYRQHRRAHLGSAAIILLFLLPLALDLLQGAPNFRAILLHLHGNGGGGKNLLQSALYFLTFVTHTDAPENLLQPVGLETFQFIAGNPLAFIGWLAALGLFAFGALRLRRLDPDGDGLRLLWRFWWVAGLLCLAWGLLQEGPMFAFNGFFYHSLHFVVYLGAATVIGRWIRIPPAAWLTVPAALAAGVAGYLLVRVPEDRVDHGGLHLRAATARTLELDPQPDLPKLLVFAHDYWGHAASVALALQRAGVPFRVEPEMLFMFEQRSTARREELTRPEPPFSVWRFVDAAQSDTGPLIEHGRGIAFAPAELSPTDGLIPFGQEDGFIGYQLAGISGGQNGKSWSKDPEVLLQFRPQPAAGDVILTLEARPYTHPRGPQRQRAELRLNGRLLWQGALAGPDVIEARVPQALWNARPVAHLWLHLPDAVTPVVFGDSGDWRVLGLEMTRITTRLAGASTGTAPE